MPAERTVGQARIHAETTPSTIGERHQSVVPSPYEESSKSDTIVLILALVAGSIKIINQLIELRTRTKRKDTGE